MKSNLYRNNVLHHLSNYKTNFLGINTAGIFKNSPTNYGHILPKPNEKNAIPFYNLLPTINLLDPRLQNNIKFHQYAHHLNSSQLMCLNFFLPMAEDDILLEILRKATNIEISSEANIEEASFEKVFPNKDNTNFDFYLKLTTGEEIFFEIKYTEQEFGGNCFEDGVLKTKYIDKYNNYYKAALQNSLISQVTMNEFFKDYQINRNLSYADKNQKYVIFIIPFISNDLLNELTTVINRYNCLNNYVKVIDWTSLCNIALAESKNSILHQHFKLFIDKYIIQ